MGKSTLLKELLQGQTRVILFDPHLEHENLGALQKAPPEDDERPYSFRWIITCSLQKEEQKAYVTEWALWAYEQGNIVFAIDEADVVFNVRDPVLPEGLFNILQYGRHRNITLICLARRPHEIHRTVTALADEFYLFQQTEPRDIEFIRQTLSQEDVDDAKNLQEYEYLHIVL